MKIAQIRRQNEITQDTLASKCGTTQQQIAKIEKGLVDPKLSTLRRLADALGCEVRDLFFSKKEFIAEINAVIRESKINLRKTDVVDLNSICASKKRLPSFHPFWELVEIKENRISLKEKSDV